MARLFCIPGVTLIFLAFVLNLIVSVSLPYLPALDITRTQFNQTALEDGQNAMTELRFGIWSPCYYNLEDDRTCASIGYAYNVSATNSGRSNEVTIAASWTRGLAVHPVATVVSLLATALALSEHVTVALMASLTAWLASLITFIAFAIDIALYVWTKRQFKKLNVGSHTTPGPGFWISLVAFILLFVGGFSTLLGRIKDRRAKHHAAEAAINAKAAAAAADEKADFDTQTPPAAPAKTSWVSKLKFGKKSQA